MAMVSNKFLGALNVKLGLHRHLQFFGATLLSQITHYAEAIQMAEGNSNGAMNYWLSVEELPKVGSSHVNIEHINELTNS